MKRKHLIIFLIIGYFCVYSIAIKDFSHSYFGVYGKRASIMGKVDGSSLEVWCYPYKVLHNLTFNITVDGTMINPYKKILDYKFSHEFFERKFFQESFVISERIFPSLDAPYAFIIYSVRTLKDMEIEFFFIPDLSPMWPASIGGKYSYWDKGGFFILSEAKGRSFAFFGPKMGEKLGSLPAHKLPGGKLRFKVKVKKGEHIIPLIAFAGKGRMKDLKSAYSFAWKNYKTSLKERIQYIKEFKGNTLQFITPDDNFNRAFIQAKLNLNFAFVNNPHLGEGLIAGYGLSGEGERPGFAWYFGGDGLINSYALLNYGDFVGAKKELEFLFKYQREDGKIPHEISQGAEFIDWFKGYGFPYFHGDTTLHFVTFLGDYIKRTGDIKILNKYKKKLDKIFNWMIKVDKDQDGIVETRLAGTGASETGPLRQKMKTDIYLAALSCTGFAAMKDIYTILKDPKRALMAEKRFKKSQESCKDLFWDQDKKYYSYAVKDNNQKIDEVTIWPAIGMRHKVFNNQRGFIAQKKISSPHLSTDWGVRFLSLRSKYYDPLSYNNGAVWPFLTGYASIGLYQYGNPYHGLSLLMANINIINDFDYQGATELLSGFNYIPLEQSVPDQIWSSGNTISACIEGLLGFSADCFKKKIYLNPALPLFWNGLEVRNLKISKGEIDIIYDGVKPGYLDFYLNIRNLTGFDLFFSTPILSKEKIMFLEGQKIKSLNNPIKINSNHEKVKISYKISGYLFPYIQYGLKYGQESQSPILEGLDINGEDFNINVWGRGVGKIYLISDREITNHRVLKNNGQNYISVRFKDDWERKVVTLKTKPRQGNR